jgi:ABC-type transporter Mla MlaB component
MDTADLAVKTIRDGAVCTLILSGELDCASASGLVQHAARVVGDRTERFVLDLAGVTFFDYAALGPQSGLRDDVTTQKEHDPAERATWTLTRKRLSGPGHRLAAARSTEVN